jgi:hypothetical protein
MSVARILVFALLFVSAQVHAVKVGELELPDRWQVGDEQLVLNGAGMREVGILRIAVYAGALYLPKRETSASAILDATTTRVIHLQMLRNVSRADSVKAWTHYLEANCEAPCAKKSEAFKSALRQFQQIIPDTRAGDTQTYVFRDGATELLLNGASLGDIRDRHFTRALLASWIGRVPTTEDLRRALLAGKP